MGDVDNNHLLGVISSVDFLSHWHDVAVAESLCHNLRYILIHFRTNIIYINDIYSGTFNKLAKFVDGTKSRGW